MKSGATRALNEEVDEAVASAAVSPASAMTRETLLDEEDEFRRWSVTVADHFDVANADADAAADDVEEKVCCRRRPRPTSLEATSSVSALGVG